MAYKTVRIREKTDTVAFRLAVEVREELYQLAEKERRSVSGILAMIVEDYLHDPKRKPLNKMIQRETAA